MVALDADLQRMLGVEGEFTPSTNGDDALYLLRRIRMKSRLVRSLFLQQLRCLSRYPRTEQDELLLYLDNDVISRAALYALRQCPDE